jgi:hypothetical protein
MRITGTDKSEIYGKYVQINEMLNYGVGVPKQLRTTSIGNEDSAEAVARRPAAATGGSGNQAAGFPGSVAPGADESCEEEAVDMAKGQLLNLAHKAVELFETIHHGGDLEPWAASKITLALDYIESVADYMMYNPEAHEHDHEQEPSEVESIEIER